LIDVGGALYGTTKGGGKSSCSSYYGCGTVFSITPDGTEKVVYRFSSGTDGSHPIAGLIDVSGTLYGTTRFGGTTGCYASGCGTVFSITPSGKAKVLHRFRSGGDGSFPAASLIEIKGTLYGTTGYGGQYNGSYYCSYDGCGTVFSISPSGKERVLHSFGNGTDGAIPVASLVEVKGTLYGTTDGGGTYGGGTVFTITPSGKEKVLHSFGNGTDGLEPDASLIDVKGTLYGTTSAGGAYSCGNSSYSCGTVFSITPSGKERVIHSFGSVTDGLEPYAPLIDVKGTLYGTTGYGGAYQCQDGACGTVFSITPSGTEKVLHSFGSGTDGIFPAASLIDVGGTLYGTTRFGGTSGNGMVFALSP
jgi:uncharacterized repeat protein (TIGR03803 family)